MNKKMLCLIVGIAFNFLFILNAEAVNHFVRQGATGNGNDWTNAYGSLPATLIRGDTYYIARGSYSGRTFNTPASGNLYITIKGATVADHGGAVPGWSNSYSVDVADGGSQAIWTSSVKFSTSYWVFDGAAGPNLSKNPNAYGFTFPSTNGHPIVIGSPNTGTTNFTISHVAATAPSGDQEKLFLSTAGIPQTDNVTLSHSYFNGWQNVCWANAADFPNTQDNWLAEYLMVLNQWGSAANHSESINNVWSKMMNLIVRYSWFEGASGGITGTIIANGNDNVNAKIYGNVFKDLKGGNGLITGTSAGNLVSPQVYNNTFINKSADSGGWIGGNTTGTPIVRNNLIYNMSAAKSVSGDYNAYYNTTNTPSEPHGVVKSGMPPFVNFAAGDLRLSAPIGAGATLAPEYSYDAYGNIRGTGGTWDIGAFEAVGATAPTPVPVPTLSPPSGLRI